jgi:hypothetical protein
MAIRFDASGDSLSRTRLAGAKTVMAWIYIATDRNDYTAFFGLGDNEIVATTTTGTTLLHYDGAAERTGTNLVTGTWYHLAYASAGDDIGNGFTVYLNGVSDITSAGRGGTGTGTNMYLGNDAYSEWLNGRIAHVKIWNAQLTQAEIQQEMYKIQPQRFANLWCWMPMIETGSSRDNEWSGSGNSFAENGTLTDEAGPPVSWGMAPWVVPFVASGGGTTYNQSAAGSVAPSGANVRRTNKALAGALSLAGALVRAAGKSLAGVLAPAGTLARSTAKSLAGALGLAGALAAVRTVLVSVGGALSLAGALERQTAKPVAGALGLAGALAADLVAGVIEQAVGGVLGLAGALSRQTNITTAGALAFSGAVARSIAKSLAGALGLAGGLVRALFGPSASKLDVTLSDAAQTTLTIASAAQTALTIANAAQTTLTIGDAAV